MNRTVAFILSTNYAGSHFLSLMLGSHSRAEHVGEVRHLRKPGTDRTICALCGSREACPLFKEITPDRVDQAYDLIFTAAGDGIDTLIDNSKKPEWAERFLGHSGFERMVIKGDLALQTNDYFHNLHHKYFECNYGGDGTVPLDKWFGTFHDGSEDADEVMKKRYFERQKKAAAKV